MKSIQLTLLSLSLFLTACALPADQDDGPSASATDLERLSNTEWAGTLGYLDYSSGKWSSIPVSMRFDAANAREIRFQIKYPGEAQYNDSDKLKVSRNGRAFNGESILARRDDGGVMVLVTQSRGRDDGRPADIQMTYELSDTALTIAKSVKFDGDATFFRRNSYELTRQGKR